MTKRLSKTNKKTPFIRKHARRLSKAGVASAVLLAGALGSAGSAEAQAASGLLLVTEFGGGSVINVAEGGDFTGKPRFATGLNAPLPICVGPGDRILVGEYGAGEVTDITAGGNFTTATPFASGIPGVSGLACSSTKIYAGNRYTGEIYDITQGGSVNSETTPFATIPAGNLNFLKFDSQGRLWAADYTGIWNISAGGSFTAANRYATLSSATSFGVVGMAELNGKGYLGIDTQSDGRQFVVELASGVDLANQAPFASVLPTLRSFSGARGRLFGTRFLNDTSALYDLTAGGDFGEAAPFATGIGNSYFGGMLYYTACGDGILQTGLGEQCDDGEDNSDSVAGACRTNCRAASCGDGVKDPGEACDLGANNSAEGACLPSCTLPCDDQDSDGVCDTDDGCITDPHKSTPGVCGCGVADTDTDEDGTPDCNDACDEDASKTEAGVCGCGVTDADTDEDGAADCDDECDADAAKTVPGLCGCGVSDADTDEDGTVDCQELCDTDPTKTAPGICGCGVSDADSDADGIADCDDVCLGDDSTGDDDADGICNDRDGKTLFALTNFDGAAGTCSAGGVRIDYGIDEDASGTLSPSEIEQASYVCNGVQGVDGKSVLVRGAVLATSSALCPQGGVQFSMGVDDDRDGTLSESEVDATQALCHGVNSLIGLSGIGVGSAQCPAGGFRVAVGLDVNHDGVLETAEERESRAICHGLKSLTRSSSLADKSEDCAYGGLKVESGIDADGNGSLELSEVSSTTVLCAANGLVVRTQKLSTGSSECAAGGTKIDLGVDANGDHTLNDNEVQSSEVSCTAVGMLIDTETLSQDAKVCAHGGIRVKFGYDNGAKNSQAGDGVLQAGEITSSHDVCLAATDVLIQGGSSACSVQPGQRGSLAGLWASLALLSLAVTRRRKSQRAN